MLGLNGYLVFIALVAASATFALLGAWWPAGACLAAAIAVFAKWPVDRSAR